MQLEVILPLIAYLLVVFALSIYAMRKRATGSFLNEYFLGSRSMGGIVLAMTLTATYISASSFIGGPGAAYKYGLGWVLLAMIDPLRHYPQRLFCRPGEPDAVPGR